MPTTEQQRIVAYFGQTYLPGWLPRGYIYARWQPLQGSADAFGEYLQIYFGDHGRQLQWTDDVSADPQETSHDECSKHPYGRIANVNGKRIVYVGGAVGQSATLERIAASAIPVG